MCVCSKACYRGHPQIKKNHYTLPQTIKLTYWQTDREGSLDSFHYPTFSDRFPGSDNILGGSHGFISDGILCFSLDIF